MNCEVETERHEQAAAVTMYRALQCGLPADQLTNREVHEGMNRKPDWWPTVPRVSAYQLPGRHDLFV